MTRPIVVGAGEFGDFSFYDAVKDSPHGLGRVIPMCGTKDLVPVRPGGVMLVALAV